jgi:hypothetical protein
MWKSLSNSLFVSIVLLAILKGMNISKSVPDGLTAQECERSLGHQDSALLKKQWVEEVQ